MTPRMGGRPPGQFEFMMERCRRLVGNLADTTYCNASDRFLAKRLGCSERSIRRYILALKNRGLLMRTTVAMKRGERWTRKRVMKLRSGDMFGPTREEVRAFHRKIPERVCPQPNTRQTHPLEAFRVKLNTVEGFGDPYHEDMNTGDRPGYDAVITPPAVLKQRLAEVQAKFEAGLKPDPEHQKLRARYILAQAARRRNGGAP